MRRVNWSMTTITQWLFKRMDLQGREINGLRQPRDLDPVLVPYGLDTGLISRVDVGNAGKFQSAWHIFDLDQGTALVIRIHVKGGDFALYGRADAKKVLDRDSISERLR